MRIKNLTLKNFRNYTEETFSFGEELSVLTGANAQGKTNAAEAVFFLCTGYSPRAVKDKLVVKNGCETAEIEGVAESLYGDVSVRIVFNRNDRKKVYINGCETDRIGELMGNINSVFFNPAELKLVQDSPEDRRRFMNISLSQMSKNYFYSLQRYNKILFQRNNLLKDKDLTLIKDTLPVWDTQLCKAAAAIIKQRNAFLAEIAPVAREKHLYLSGGKEILEMKSESGYSGTEEEIHVAFASDLKDGFERDLRLGYTATGPHRDDIKFILNGEDVRVFGSQGQQRTVALSLKLAETEIFKSRFGEYPILILDDVLSELDRKRQKRLIEATLGIQTIFTATGVTNATFKGREYTHVVIENGKIKKTAVCGG